MASIASTYARAFADVVFSMRLDAIRAITGLQRITTLFNQSVELRRVWENPAVPADQKRNLLDAIVQREGLEKPVRNLVAVLIDHRRLPFLPRIVEQFEKTRFSFGFCRSTDFQCPRVGRRRKTGPRSPDPEDNGQEGSRKLRTGRIAIGRRSRSRRQHNLRRFREGAIGKNSRADIWQLS